LQALAADLDRRFTRRTQEPACLPASLTEAATHEAPAKAGG